MKKHLTQHGDIKVGDYAEITDEKFFTKVNGLAGEVVDIFETDYENFNNGVFFTIKAENCGTYMVGGEEGKGAMAWKIGNIRSSRREALTKVE